jgi:hypothetical protein
LSSLICYPWAHSSNLTQLSTLLGSDFGVLGNMWSQNDVSTSWLRLAALYPHDLAQIWGFWGTCGVKMMSLRHGWGWKPPQTASPIRIRHIKVFEHIDMLSIGVQYQLT